MSARKQKREPEKADNKKAGLPTPSIKDKPLSKQYPAVAQFESALDEWAKKSRSSKVRVGQSRARF